MPVFQSIAIKVSKRHSLIFCRYIRHEILFQAYYNGTVINSRKQVDDALVCDIWFRHFYKKDQRKSIAMEKCPGSDNLRSGQVNLSSMLRREIIFNATREITMQYSAVAQWICTHFVTRWPRFNLGHFEISALVKGLFYPSSRGCGGVGVRHLATRFLLHASCLIIEFRCLMSLDIVNKDAIFYNIINNFGSIIIIVMVSGLHCL